MKKGNLFWRGDIDMAIHDNNLLGNTNGFELKAVSLVCVRNN
jgi:hypothetical protein